MTTNHIDPTHARSICECGHSGDGPDSQHAGFIGHGPCFHEGCDCVRFTWKHFTSEFIALYALTKRNTAGGA